MAGVDEEVLEGLFEDVGELKRQAERAYHRVWSALVNLRESKKEEPWVVTTDELPDLYSESVAK